MLSSPDCSQFIKVLTALCSSLVSKILFIWYCSLEPLASLRLVIILQNPWRRKGIVTNDIYVQVDWKDIN